MPDNDSPLMDEALRLDADIVRQHCEDLASFYGHCKAHGLNGISIWIALNVEAMNRKLFESDPTWRLWSLHADRLAVNTAIDDLEAMLDE